VRGREGPKVDPTIIAPFVRLSGRLSPTGLNTASAALSRPGAPLSTAPTPRLIAISPGDGRPLAGWIDALSSARWPTVLLREPEAPAARWRAEAERAEAQGLQVIVHARCPGAEDGPYPLHRPSGPQPPPGAAPVWGQSCHKDDDADAIFAQGRRYVLLSPVWSPGSKPDDRRPTLGLAGLRAWASGRPVLALGGVDADRLRALAQAGAWGAALLSPFAGPDPEAAARALRSAWRQGGGPD